MVSQIPFLRSLFDGALGPCPTSGTPVVDAVSVRWISSHQLCQMDSASFSRPLSTGTGKTVLDTSYKYSKHKSTQILKSGVIQN